MTSDPLDQLLAQADHLRQDAARALDRHRAAAVRHAEATAAVQADHRAGRVATGLAAMCDAVDEMLAASTDHGAIVRKLYDLEERIESLLEDDLPPKQREVPDVG